MGRQARNPWNVLLFFLVIVTVAYLCKRGWDGFYSTPLPSDMPPDMGSPIRVGDYIYVHNTSPGAVSQPASFNMGVENKAWVINTPTPTEAQLKAAPQDDKTLISMFQWDWGVGSRSRGWYTYNGRTVYGRYVGGNSHWWSISYVVKPPTAAAPARAALPPAASVASVEPPPPPAVAVYMPSQIVNRNPVKKTITCNTCPSAPLLSSLPTPSIAHNVNLPHYCQRVTDDGVI
jgi:hypothetical protein